MEQKQPLTAILHSDWTDYRELVDKTSLNISTEHIHDLRVASQALEAVITTAASLPGIRNPLGLVKAIRKLRRALGPLRDLQVEETPREQSDVGPKLAIRGEHKFRKFIKLRTSSEGHTAQRRLRNSKLKKQGKAISEMYESVSRFEMKNAHGRISRQLSASLAETECAFNQALMILSPFKVSTVHEFRGVVKRFRYQTIVFERFTGRGDASSSRLKKIQHDLGVFQDAHALGKNIDRFLEKSTREEIFMRKKRREMDENETSALPEMIKKLVRENFLR